jgi:hypothetical protein
LAFQMLKVQPGTVPICHFVPQDHVVWISKWLIPITYMVHVCLNNKQ